MKAVVENPGTGEPMLGNMLGLYKVSFGERPQYRLLYRKYECCQKPGEEIECPTTDPDTPDGECKGVVTFIFLSRQRRNATTFTKRIVLTSTVRLR